MRKISAVVISKKTRRCSLVTACLVFGTDHVSVTSNPSLLFSQLMHKWFNFKVKMKNSGVPPSPRATLAQFHSRTDRGKAGIENCRWYWADQYQGHMTTPLCICLNVLLLWISTRDAANQVICPEMFCRKLVHSRKNGTVTPPCPTTTTHTPTHPPTLPRRTGYCTYPSRVHPYI